jgi:ATP-dependent exoDNAse (exonuclease V) alpha subunit
VANFLLKGELAAGAVVVVDEAGQIGGRQMHELLRLAHECNARVILSGDTRQHGAVEASDALLAIERYSGIKPVELRTIRRQDPALARNQAERAQIKQYRKGERLHLKANRKLAGGGRTINGELVTVKAVRPDSGIELADGRTLDKGFREFLPGYAVTSYGSQGKTVDHVLFSDSTVKAATNAQQWYVTISRGRRGIRIFTPDKIQLRENLVRSGHRPLAMELAPGFRPYYRNHLWDRLHGCLLRFGRRAADTFCRLKQSRHRRRDQNHEHKITTMLRH